MENREKLINKIEYLRKTVATLTCPDYQDLSIYSLQYYKNIISNLFDNPSSTFSYMYGDFDGLSVLNNLHGFKVGTEALYNALAVITSVLPEGALVSRIGGDEFSIILPFTNKDEAEIIKRQINTALAKYSLYTSGLSITLAVEDSTKGTLDELCALASAKVERKKHTHRNLESPLIKNMDLEIPNNIPPKEAKNWEKLNALIDFSVKNHLSDIRASNEYEYSLNDLKKESITITNIFSNLIENSNIGQKTPKLDTYDESFSQSSEKYKDFASSIHYFLHSFDFEHLSDYSDSDLQQLYDNLKLLLSDLSINENSKLLNESYWKKYLADKLIDSKNPIKAAVFTASGIRTSNSAFGHNKTTKRMVKTSDLLYESLSKYLSDSNYFDNDLDSNGFLIDHGAGNYLVVLPKASSYDEFAMQATINKINKAHDPDDSQSSFKIAGAFSNELNISDKKHLLHDINKLRKAADLKKDTLKIDSITDITNITAFKNTMFNPVKFYLKNIPDAKSDINKKQLLIKNVFTSLLTNMSKHNNKKYDEHEDIR